MRSDVFLSGFVQETEGDEAKGDGQLDHEDGVHLQMLNTNLTLKSIITRNLTKIAPFAFLFW